MNVASKMMGAYRRAFTLAETLMVIGVVGLLFTLTLPAIQRLRAVSDQLVCANNLRQISLALHQFHNDHGHLPTPRRTTYNISWMAHLLPYIGEDGLWTQTQAACAIEPRFTYNNPPHQAMTAVVRLYVCSTDELAHQARVDDDGIFAGLTSYIGVRGDRGADGVMDQRPSISLSEIYDGTSNTLMLGERPVPEVKLAGWWYSYAHVMGFWGALYGPDFGLLTSQPTRPYDSCTAPFPFGPGRSDNPCDRYRFWSHHPAGANFAFADASVRFLTYRSAGKLLPMLATRSGGELVELPD